MGRRQKKLGSWVALTLSIASLLALIIFSSIVTSLDSSPVIGLCIIVSMSVFLVAVIGIFAYSDDKWEVRGSTLEWILAAIISPFTALFLYLIGGEHKGRE